MKTVTIATDFTRYPAGRVRTDGPYSGEAFREDYLEPELKIGERVHIILDGARGYGSSFLEEAFGGLRRQGYTREQIEKLVEVESNEDPSLIGEINSYINT